MCCWSSHRIARRWDGLEGDRNRQARRRRNAGATGKRGRPALNLSPEEKQERIKAQAAERKRRSRMSRKNSHASSYIRGMKRDGFSVTQTPPRPLVTGIDFAAFGITSVRIMSGQNVISAWSSAPP
jgi:hypothetical protein